MKNLVWMCLSAFILTGCTGGIWPEPGTPHPGKPEDPKWALTKVIKRLKYELGYIHITKTVDEYLYNEHHKPIIHRYYHNAADSNNLNLGEVDSVFPIPTCISTSNMGWCSPSTTYSLTSGPTCRKYQRITGPPIYITGLPHR